MAKKEPITISWDELGTRKVDQRVREEQAISRNRTYAQLDAAKVQVDNQVKFSLLHNTLFFLAMLGTLGGLLAWSCGLLTQFKSSEQQALSLYRGLTRIEFQRDDHTLLPIRSPGLDRNGPHQRPVEPILRRPDRPSSHVRSA